MIPIGVPGYGPPHAGFRLLRIAQRTHRLSTTPVLISACRRRPVWQFQALQLVRLRLAGLPIQNVQGRQVVVFALVRYVGKAAAIGRKTGVKIAESFCLDQASFDHMVPNGANALLVFAAERPHPVRIDAGRITACCLLQGLLNIPGVPFSEPGSQLAQYVLPVRGGKIVREREPLIVYRLAQQAGMRIKSPHLGKGQFLAGQHPGPQHHIAVGIPVIVVHERALVLRRPLRQPGRIVERRYRVRNDHVGIAVQHVRPLHILVIQILEIQEGKPATRLHRRLHLHHVRKFVSDHIAQPVVVAA